MKTIKYYIFLLLLILPAKLFAANVFTNDTSCKALWRFESQVTLMTDSKSTNNLSYYGLPTVDLSDYVEGVGSLNNNSATNDRIYIIDANLSAGFPLKSGDATQKITMCCWIKPNIGDGGYYIPFLGKEYGAVGLRMAQFNHYLYIGWPGAAESPIPVAQLLDGSWYHVGVVIDGVNKTWLARVWNGSTASTYSGTASATTWTLTGDFTLCTSENYDTSYNGHLDEIAIFNRLLTATEIDAIRGGTYNETYPAATASSSITLMGD